MSHTARSSLLREWPIAIVALLATLLVATGCEKSEDPLPCAKLAATCTPLYEPTFDQIFARTLRPTCGQPGVSCHARTGAQAGLVFEDPDESHRLLTRGDGRARATIIQGDIACSPLVVRIEAGDPARAMPPGRPLPEAERCAIIRWLQQGAPR